MTRTNAKIIATLLLVGLFVPALVANASTQTIYASSHITGTFTNPANAVGAADGVWAGQLNTSTSQTSRWAMTDPAGALTGTQTISVVAKKGSNSGTPTIAINLWENGTLVQSIVGATNVTNTVSQTISGTFDGSVISNQNNVEIEVVMTAAGGNPSTRNSAEIDDIQWDVSYTAPTAPTVSTSAATSVTATSATIGGNITSINGAAPTVRGFATSTNATLSSSVSTTTNSGSFGTGAWTASYSNTSVTGNTTYYFRAYATNSAGTGYGSILNFLTLPGTPGNPSYSSVTQTSMSVSWTAPTGGASTYNLERCITSTTTCTKTTSISGTTQAVSSLTMGTSYDFAVQGVNGTGTGAWSATTTQATVSNVAPTVALNSPSDTGTVTSTTPDLTFTNTDSDGDAVTNEVEVDTANTFDSHVGGTPTIIDTYNESNGDAQSGLQSGFGTALGQSFQAVATYTTLNSAKFYVSSDSGLTGSAVAKIYAHTGTFGSGGTPTGSAIATSDSVNLTTFPVFSTFTLVTFNFTGANQITLTPGTAYFVTIEASTNSVHNAYVKYDSTSPTAAGNGATRSSGGTWSSSAVDYVFYVYGTAGVPLLDKLSASDTGFTDVTNGADTDPFASGDQIKYTVQAGDALTNGNTYYWRVRGKDPAGTNTFGSWSSIRSFIVSATSGSVPTDYQNLIITS